MARLGVSAARVTEAIRANFATVADLTRRTAEDMMREAKEGVSMLLTTNPEEAALMAAIIADPTDDAPRLALADWYMENGHEERGEQISVMIEHGKEVELQHTSTDWYFSLFAEAYRSLLAKGLRGHRWKRGFLYSVLVAHHVWEKHAAEVLSSHPVEVVRLKTVPSISTYGNPVGEYRAGLCSIRLANGQMHLAGSEAACIEKWSAQWTASRPWLRIEPPKEMSWLERPRGDDDGGGDARSD